ncbi:MAG: FHA domain-containing protein [Ktedonobacterales bacterium]|nr:FHA domain-containing protein [Ktedonobacterales bacterium]
MSMVGELKGRPRLVMQGGLTIELHPKEAWVVGRTAPDAQDIDVDLTSYGAEAGGVSRHHIRIRRTLSGFTVEDLGSINETCLNHERIPGGQPFALTHGDRLSLGNWRGTFLVDD